MPLKSITYAIDFSTGALLGARDGETAIPKRWLDTLVNSAQVRDTARKLLQAHLLVSPTI